MLIRHQYSSSNENGTWKRCLHKREAKQARNTHWYTFSMQSFTSFNSINFPEHKANYTVGCKKIICSHDYDVTLGGVTHKSWYLGTTMKDPKSEFVHT